MLYGTNITRIFHLAYNSSSMSPLIIWNERW